MVTMVDGVVATKAASISAVAEEATKTTRVVVVEMADLLLTATDLICLTIPTAIQTT